MNVATNSFENLRREVGREWRLAPATVTACPCIHRMALNTILPLLDRPSITSHGRLERCSLGRTSGLNRNQQPATSTPTLDDDYVLDYLFSELPSPSPAPAARSSSSRGSTGSPKRVGGARGAVDRILKEEATKRGTVVKQRPPSMRREKEIEPQEEEEKVKFWPRFHLETSTPLSPPKQVARGPRQQSGGAARPGVLQAPLLPLRRRGGMGRVFDLLDLDPAFLSLRGAAGDGGGVLFFC